MNVGEYKALSKKAFCFVVVASFALVLHSLYLFYVSGDKKALSAVVLVAILFTVPFFSNVLAKLEFQEFERVLRGIIHSLSLIGWAGLIYAHFLVDSGQRIKYPFPFPEPSFFALCYGLFSVGYACVSSWRFSAYLILNLLCFSFLFPSLTFLLFAAIIFLLLGLRLRSIYFLTGVFIFPVVIFMAGYFLVADMEYFSSRLRFADTDNITTLVWLQGWDLSYRNLISSDWLGLGFQMLGEDTSELGELSYKLQSLTGKFMNISSGGFLAAKIIIEFGVLGVGVSLLYFSYLVWFSLKVAFGRVFREKNKEDFLFEKKKLILQGLVFGYAVEFFFRGYGYFSPCLYVVVSAALAIWKMNSYPKSSQKSISSSEF
ncbi:hypothetical protein GIV75_10940 [Pseudomonas sp. PA-3-5D]|uniref:hypothetical protein n=4 Tax=unclassified Pseudomonas TaxID=196821 RepID=UPI001F351E5A|nr:hypothetical protein [Pseudomonas sp. PA-3-5D]MCF5561396.1 hypothetical protein [Pseudomonas sp. PA-3-5D]